MEKACARVATCSETAEEGGVSCILKELSRKQRNAEYLIKWEQVVLCYGGCVQNDNSATQRPRKVVKEYVSLESARWLSSESSNLMPRQTFNKNTLHSCILCGLGAM